MSNILDRCPVPILQEPWEFGKLMEIFVSHGPQKVLEIGSFYGGTLWFWLQAKTKRAAVKIVDGGRYEPSSFKTEHVEERCVKSLTSVDFPIGPNDGRFDEMKSCRGLWPSWVEGIEFHDIQGNSHDPNLVKRVYDLHPHKDIDFLFIDGDHSYAGVRADYENYAPLVRSGGLIVFHDVFGLPEVARFWNEVKKWRRATEIYGHPDGWGIGIIEKQ